MHNLKWLTLTLILLTGCTSLNAQTLEGKKFIGGHGFAMPTTHLFNKYNKEMQRFPMDGTLICVNRNEYATQPKLRQLRPHDWFQQPVTIEDYSFALNELKNTDKGTFKHNILWTSGTRRMSADWFDDNYWKNTCVNNAKVMAEVYKQGNFEAIWFDIETGGNPAGMPLTWNGWLEQKGHSYHDSIAKVRQRGRELMQAYTSVVPDFKLIISHAYGLILKLDDIQHIDDLKEKSYSLLPAFLDGLLEGCGEHGQLIESGETTYGTMTYAGYKAWIDWDAASAKKLSTVPHLLKKNYRHATAMWIDFAARSVGWFEQDLEKNHFSPERMKHAIHNALAASDEFVWTYDINAHWWPLRGAVPNFGKKYIENPPARLFVLPDAYIPSVAQAKQPMDLNWHPNQTNEKGYDKPVFDNTKALASLKKKYEQVEDMADGWAYCPTDSSHILALDWGIPLYTFGSTTDKVNNFRPIKLGDYWENQGFAQDGIGAYRRKLIIPSNARNKRLYLAIGPSSGRTTLYLANTHVVRGKPIGVFNGKQLTVFDITDDVDLEGENSLTILVSNPSGPGGLYGTVQLLAKEKSRDAYVELRGTETGKWFQWIKDGRHGNLDHLAKENTIEVKVRIPDLKPLNANIWCTTEDGGATLQFQPDSFKFLGKWHNFKTTTWHVYRIVTAKEGDAYRQTLYIDDEEFASDIAQPIKIDPAKPRLPGVGFGIGWGYPTTEPIRMDLAYFRWANRPFTPADEENAKRSAPEAQARKLVFWDGSYDGSVLPQNDGWMWWYDNDPRPYSRIISFEEKLELGDPANRVSLFDWSSKTGGRLVLRDAPRVGAKDGQHGTIEAGPFAADKQQYNARLVLYASEKIAWGWPGVTATDLDKRDVSDCAAMALQAHNPTDKPQLLGLSIRDAQGSVWQHQETFQPGETKVLGVRTDALQKKVLTSDIHTVTLFTVEPKQSYTFLVSPLYALRK